MAEPVASGGAHANIGAVVTAFNPGVGLFKVVQTLAAQTGLVVVVNDAPESCSDFLNQASELGAIVVAHHTNRGIAAALNTGIAELRLRRPEIIAVLTCDQDSLLPEGYVSALLETWRLAVREGVEVGMVAPAAAGNIGRLPGVGPQLPGAHDRVMIGGEPIQSGLLIPTSTLDDLGAFDESLFIDGVDSDFYLRAITAGLSSVIAPVTIEHQLGRTQRVGIGPLRRDVTVAADYRYYYRVRNVILLAKRYFRKHPNWVVRSLLKEVRHELITLALVRGRKRRLAMAMRGLLDGIRNSDGKMPGSRS